jgi:hypothetical protein
MHEHDDIFETWLAAERDGRDAAAERALRGLFAALPPAVPAADFAGRVLAAAGLPRRFGLDPWWSRAAVAACLLLAGLASALVLPLVVSLTAIVAPGEAVGALIEGWVALASRVDELLSLWHVWARIVETVMLIASAPPVVLSLLTLTVLSALTFRGLERALVTDRSPDHVPAC